MDNQVYFIDTRWGSSLFTIIIGDVWSRLKHTRSERVREIMTFTLVLLYYIFPWFKCWPWCRLHYCTVWRPVQNFNCNLDNIFSTTLSIKIQQRLDHRNTSWGLVLRTHYCSMFIVMQLTNYTCMLMIIHEILKVFFIHPEWERATSSMTERRMHRRDHVCHLQLPMLFHRELRT